VGRVEVGDRRGERGSRGDDGAIVGELCATAGELGIARGEGEEGTLGDDGGSS
jgi:hypothetical protein